MVQDMMPAPIEGQLEEKRKSHAEAVAEYLSPETAALEVTDADELTCAMGILKDIRQRRREIESVLKSATEPLMQGLSTIRAWFKPDLVRCKEADELWEGKIRSFHEAASRARAGAARELQAAVDAGDKTAAKAALVRAQPAPRSEVGTVFEVWDFEEQNHEIVPTQFTILDTVAVRAEMQRQLREENVAAPAVAGIRFFKAIRTRT